MPTETRLCFLLPGKTVLIALKLTYHETLSMYHVYIELKGQKVVSCLEWNGNTKCRKNYRMGIITFYTYVDFPSGKCKKIWNINNNNSNGIGSY